MKTPCIESPGARTPKGYVRLRYQGKAHYAHRVAWDKANGHIPADKCVMHRCDNPACVRLDHLVLGSTTDNNRDMTAKGRHWQLRKTHCPQGHEYTPENCYQLLGHRQCVTCTRERARKAKRRTAVGLEKTSFDYP